MGKISFVIPVYNSEKTIGEVVKKIEETMRKFHSGFAYEIILVNDSSKDNTLDVCKLICEQRKYIKLINFSKNFGQMHAIIAGLRYTEGDYVICMDDDMQNPPEEIGKLIAALEEKNYDVVYGIYDEKKHSTFRNLGSFVNQIIYYLIDKPKGITTTSFFIAKRFVIDEVIRYDNSYPHIAGLIFRTTSNIGNVLVKHQERKIGTSNYTFKKLFKLLFYGPINFSIKPLRCFSFIGILVSLISFIGIIFTLSKKIITPQVQLGWTSIMVSIAFFGGVQLIGIGVLGEYIGRAFLAINKTPQYVIKETYETKGKKNG